MWFGFTHAPRYTELVGIGGGDNAAAGGVVVVGAEVEVECGADVVEEDGAVVGEPPPPQLANTMPTAIATNDTATR
jgi:hypothetical protein